MVSLDALMTSPSTGFTPANNSCRENAVEGARLRLTIRELAFKKFRCSDNELY